MTLEIYKYPHPVLNSPSVEVDLMGKNRQEIFKFAEEMLELFFKGFSWGMPVGLAAPQVGKNWKIFIAEIDGFPQIFFNPEIIWTPKEGKVYHKEGCYSLDENRFDYPVWRYPSIRLKWQDINGESQERRFNGKSAQIIQHEYDHLLGICCVDKHD